jgi:hypothetical protein
MLIPDQHRKLSFDAPALIKQEESNSAYEYFRLGEIVHGLTRYEYFQVIANGMTQRLDAHRAFMHTLHLSQESLAAVDELAAVVLSLPFAKEPNFSKWSSADQEKWRQEGWGAQRKLSSAMKTDMEKNPQSKFFYWLGVQSMRLSWSVPLDVNDHGYKVSAVKATVKGYLADFEWLRNQNTTETLAPEVTAAIKFLASMKAKIDDPFDEFTKQELDKVAESAQLIRDAAKEKKLLRASITKSVISSR